jgi:phosphoribosylaminoimidazolecarboxamide formyltransferase/IMP cyclohydrolase
VIASKEDYQPLVDLLQQQSGNISAEQRRSFAAKAFQTVAHYDIAINNYFNSFNPLTVIGAGPQTPLRYGENPHQKAMFFGNLNECFEQLHGKEISYNNLVDIEAAVELIKEFEETTFAIIKHTNVCGIAQRKEISGAWKDALAGDPESAFGGVLVCNGEIDLATAEAVNEIFFEVLIAPSFSDEALAKLKSKKEPNPSSIKSKATMPSIYKSVMNGTLQQDKDSGNFEKWDEVGERETTEKERQDLIFANIVCKHLKSNAITLVKDKQLIGKGLRADKPYRCLEAGN